MPVTATVSAGWTYTTGDTVTASNLNLLGLPSVTVPDGKDFVFGAGTVGAPSISFTGDTNTGIAQLAGAGTLSVVTDGVEAFRFINDQALAMPGADAAPAYSFAGDPNTGLNSDTADEVDIVCGGAVIGTFAPTGFNATNITLQGTAVLTAGVNPNVAFFTTDFFEGLAESSFSGTKVNNGSIASGTASIPNQALGVVRVSLGSTSADSAILCKDVPIAAGHRLTWRISNLSLSPLSNGTNRYYILIGASSIGTSEEVDGATTGSAAWFQYYDLNSAQWQTKTKSGTSLETTTTSVTVANTATQTRFDIVNNGTDTKFYINNTLVATHVTRVLAPSAVVFPFIRVTATAGTPNSQFVEVDTFEMQYTVSRA
jgi:hypothetical protein